MRVHPVRVDRLPGRLRISCEVVGGGSTDVWWIDLPEVLPWIPLGSVGVDPFLPLAGLLAGVLGEDLWVDDPVDPVLLEGLARNARRVESWWGWRPPEFRVETSDRVVVRPSLRAAMFSRGVDSSAEVAVALSGAAPALDVLVTICGNDVHWSPSTVRQQLRRTRDVSASLGLPLVEVSTNLRQVADRYAAWDDTHGAVLAGVGLALATGCGQVVVAQPVAGATEESRDRPHGTTRGLFRNWSSRRVEFVEGTAGLTRFDKVGLLVGEPTLGSNLQVCWQEDLVGNCGRCAKCLAMATALLAHGRGDLVDELFPVPCDVEAVRRSNWADPLHPGALLEVVEGLRAAVAAGRDPGLSELLDAWDEHATRLGNGDRAGLAGLSVAAELRAAGPRPDGFGVPVPSAVGWGTGATPLHAAADRRAGLLHGAVDHTRPVEWCQVDRLSPFSAQVAARLAEVRPGGVVLLAETNSPTAPPAAVRRILAASRVRCWASDSLHLEGVPLLEAVAAGCVPVQVSADASLVRAGLPEWAQGIVCGVEEVGEFLADDDRLAGAWRAAVALAVGGSLERDARLFDARLPDARLVDGAGR